MKRKTKHKNKKQHSSSKRIIGLAWIFAAVIFACVLAWLFVAANSQPQLGRLVTFYDRGKERVILTHADTVRAALKNAKIEIDPHDQVEPAIDSKLLSTDSAVIIYRSRPVLVVDGARREKVVTPAAAPSEILKVAAFNPLGNKDKVTVTTGDFIAQGASMILTIERAVVAAPPQKVIFQPKSNALTAAKGAQLYTDVDGVVHRETYYDLPMNIVIGACGSGDYTIRADGAKVDKDGYILVAANYSIYPRCSVVDTSMGPGKVYDTGGFALRYPHGFDLATDWTNYNGR